MEDRTVCHCPLADEPNLCFMGIYDGHEGSRASQLLTNQLHEKFAASLAKIPRPYGKEDVRVALKNALSAVDKDFLESAAELDWMDGSTAVVAIVFENEELMFGNVGNSRGLVCRKASSCTELRKMAMTENLESLVSLKTEDHTPNQPDERNRVVESGNSVEKVRGKWRLNGELELSRAIGDLAYRSKGLISDADFLGWHEIRKEESFLILASDGVFETMSSESVCEIAEATRLQCKYFKPSPDPDPPIALGGFVEPSKPIAEFTPPENPSHIGLEELPPGLEGCVDCGPGYENENDSVSQLPIHQTVSERIVKEAFNRGSMDNIAVSVLDIGDLGKGSDGSVDLTKQFCVGRDVGGISLIHPPHNSYKYELVGKVAGLPGVLAKQWHVHWDAETLPRPHYQPDSDGIMLADTSMDRVVLSVHALAILQPSDLAVPVIECIAPPYGNPHDVASSETCQAPFSAEALTVGLVRALGSLPMLSHLEGGGDGGDGDGVGGLEEEDKGWSFERVFQSYAAYVLQKRFAAGSFGEVWRAKRSYPTSEVEGSGPDTDLFVMKRLMVEKGEDVLRSGLRERYFGELFRQKAAEAGASGVECRGCNHLVRFIESFEVEPGPELWLVFRDEGLSLHSMMYDQVMAPKSGKIKGGSTFSGLSIVEPGQWWYRMRKSKKGDRLFKGILRELLLGIQAIHQANITHRDIKPENILLANNGEEKGGTDMHVRVIDFGSAVDNYTFHNLYGASGPTELEQTQEYAPPEARFGRLDFFNQTLPSLQSYDIWSVGVVWLEYILGTPLVFHLPGRTRALLDHRLRLSSLPEPERERAYLLRAMMEFCIYPPTSVDPRKKRKVKTEGASHQQHSKGESKSSKPEGGKLVKKRGKAENKKRKSVEDKERASSIVLWSCSEEALMKLIKSRDPTGRGLPSKTALKLLMAMLAWDPEQRISADEALEDLFFKE
ncbi:hypothetical protein BSKO_06352 [Bryopsis sp. KO-2023]|nr:hypothetical protein BSKO_06352 [Bryopsis sp. KO-2023]